MNFRSAQPGDDPELNLIPLIDVLLVILIFLAASTSFTQLRQLPIALPQASAQAVEPDAPLVLAISQEGLYALDGEYVDAASAGTLADALRKAVQARGASTLRIHADGQATHAAVVRALEAARQAGVSRVHFATVARP